MARPAASPLNFLKRFGVETTFFDPTMGDEIERLVRPNTKLFYSRRRAR